MSGSSSSSDLVYMPSIKAVVKKKNTKRLKELRTKHSRKNAEFRLKRMIKTKKAKKAKNKKKKEKASWRTNTRMGRFSKAAKKRMNTTFKAVAKSFLPKFKKTKKKKASFRESVRRAKEGSKLSAESAVWKPSKAKSDKKTSPPKSRKKSKRKKRKTRKKNFWGESLTSSSYSSPKLPTRGMMYLEDDPDRLLTALDLKDDNRVPSVKSFHSMFRHGYRDFDGSFMPDTDPRMSRPNTYMV